jgi:hypothetical protein
MTKYLLDISMEFDWFQIKMTNGKRRKTVELFI